MVNGFIDDICNRIDGPHFISLEKIGMTSV